MTQQVSVGQEQEVVPKAEHAECWRCPLYERGTFVGPTMPEEGAELAFVGEAPGRQERMRGKVFVGPSGKLVSRILRYFGIKRSSVLLTNAMKCVVESTPISSPSPTSVGYRRYYEGAVVRIKTASGRELTVTPNHPILTSRGWISAENINAGSDQVYARVGEFGEPVEPDVDNMPPSAEQVFRTLAQVGDVRGIIGQPVDFHSDGSTGQVDVVTMPGLLSDGVYASLDQSVVEHVLANSYMAESQFTGLGDSTLKGSELLSRQLSPVGDSADGFSGLSLPLLESGTAVPQLLSVGGGTSRDRVFGENLQDSGSSDSQVLTDSNAGLPSDVAADDVVFVERFFWSGHVYNFSTDANWYFAGDIVTHNCHYPEGENAPDEAIDACRPQLEAEFREAGVHQAVALGNSAARSLLDSKEGITKQRVGPPRPSVIEGVSVSPTFHPAACLRSADYYPSVLTDVSKAVVGAPSLWEEPIIHECANATEVRDECRTMRLFDGSIVVDIETGSDKDDTLERGHNIISVAMAPLHARDPDVVFIPGSVLKAEAVIPLLLALWQERGVVCQNGKFDTGQLEWLWEHNVPLAEDTMLASYVLDERRGIHGLKYMAKEFLGAPEYEAEIGQYVAKPRHAVADRWIARQELEQVPVGGMPRADLVRESRVSDPVLRRQAVELGMIEEKFGGKIWWRPDPERDHSLDIPVDADGTYASIPASLLAYYNSCDVQVTRLVWRYLRSRLEDAGEDTVNFYYWMISISEMLTDVELRGLGVDFERNRELGEYCDEGLAKVEWKLGELNPRSPKQVLEFLHSHGVPGAEGTSREILEDLEQQTWVPEGTREVVSALLEYRKWHKLKSTYVDNVRNNTYNGVLHTTFKLHGTTTGRLSSSPNVQNQPRGFGIKNQYVPPAGTDYTWVAADYGQAELRVLCWLAEDEAIRELFNDPDRDVFTELSKDMLGRDKFEEMSAYQRKEFRVQVKSFAYGLSYGREAESIAEEFGISQAAARKRMSSFRALIPDIMAYQKDIIKRVHQGRDLVNPFGRRRRFPLVTEANARAIEREAMAFMPQSTASDICLEAARRANAEGIQVCNLIHDQILAQAHHSEASEVGMRLEEIMVGTAADIVGGYVMFEAEHTIGREWEKL